MGQILRSDWNVLGSCKTHYSAVGSPVFYFNVQGNSTSNKLLEIIGVIMLKMDGSICNKK